MFAPAVAARPAPGPKGALPPEAQRRQAAQLMRVNHAGEIAAQGLYHGQALVARDPAIRAMLEHAGREETDHLAWCEERLRELQDQTGGFQTFVPLAFHPENTGLSHLPKASAGWRP